MSAGGAGDGAGDSTLDRLIRILEAFDADRPALTVAALARRAELPLATAYRWVDRLVAAELLQRSEAGTVRPGMRLWELASRGAPTVPLERAAMPFLLDVQAVLRQHTQLAVLDDDGVLILQRLSARDAVVNQATVAGRLPALTTSLGLVLLAHAAPDVVERFLHRHAGELAAAGAVLSRSSAPASRPGGARAHGMAATAADLRVRLAQVRRDGHAIVDGALDDAARGVAVPVWRGGDHTPAALGVVVESGTAVPPGLPALLMTAARGIARTVRGDSH